MTKDPELDSLIIMDSGVIEGGLNVTLTIRLLMHGKEVGSIIGKVRSQKTLKWLTVEHMLPVRLY